MTYTYDFPQASPCGATLLYTIKDNKLTLLTTRRSNAVDDGGKRSLSAGGFAEVKDMISGKTKAAGESLTRILGALKSDFSQEQLRITDHRQELYREMWEELGKEIKTLIPYQTFIDRSEIMADLNKHTKGNLVYTARMYAMEISEEVMDQIVALPNTSEQVGKVLETFDLDLYVNAEKVITERLSDFANADEVIAAFNLYETQLRRRLG